MKHPLICQLLLLLGLFAFQLNAFPQYTLPKTSKTFVMDLNTIDYIERVSITTANPKRMTVIRAAWYYWYLNNSVHYSQEGYSGKLLHGPYTSYFKNMNIRSAGAFRYGLMKGKWKNWYPAGRIKSVSHWRNGFKCGKSVYYSEDGTLRIVEKYRKGLLHGKQKTYKNNTLIEKTKYHRGIEKPCKHRHIPLQTDSLDTIPVDSLNIASHNKSGSTNNERKMKRRNKKHPPVSEQTNTGDSSSRDEGSQTYQGRWPFKARKSHYEPL